MSSQQKPSLSITCVGGCGFYGNPAMQNYCSVCFKKFVPDAENILTQITQEKSKEDKKREKTIDTNNNNDNFNLNDNNNNNNNINTNNNDNNNNNNNNLNEIQKENIVTLNDNNANNIIKEQKKKIRCEECNKKLALAQQFECKCGRMFCSIHRYADSHKCTFDYQKIQQQKLESLNPVIAPSKVQQL